MKKIKYLLLFGILTLLGIGSSFGYHSYFGLEYVDTSNRYQNFLFDSNGYGGITISSANGGTFSSLDYVRYTGKNNLSVLSYLDISNYSLTGSFSFPFSNAGTSNGYLYVDGNNIAFRYFNNSYTPNFNYLLNISNSVSLQDYFLSLKDAGVFIRTLTNYGDGIIIENPFKQSISPNGYRSFIFVDTGVYDTNIGQYVNDTEFSGVVYNRGVLSPGVLSEYSFSLVPTYSYNSGSKSFSVDYDSLPFLFRTVRPGLSNSDWTSYRGVFIIKLDSLYRRTNTGDFRILALSLSGDNYLYSRYSCPANSSSFIDCTFIDGGNVGQSNLSNSFSSFKSTSFSSIQPSSSLNLFKDLTFFLTSPDSLSFDATYSDISIRFTKSIYSIESNNIIYLYRPVRRQTSNGTTASFSNSVLERSFGLISQDGINILEDYLYQGGGNVPSYSGSVSLNDCIDTQICNNVTGSNGNIIRLCTIECVSSGVIASGGYFGSDGTYYFVNSPISIEDSLKTDNPENMFTGSYIDSGGILSLSYFTDYFQPGAKKIGVCPFKYYEGPLDFMTKVKLGDAYLLMPILCFYSAFQQGKNVSFFDEYNVNDGLFSQPILYGESDNHKLLFAFFDVLFSIGLLGLIRYLSRHLF